VLIVAALAAAVVTAAATATRQQRIEELRTHSEPLAATAEVLYSSLSIADATAANAFLSGSVEPPAVRERYDDAMRQTTTALVAAGHGVRSGDVEAITLLAQLSNRLREYTGRIDTALTTERATRSESHISARPRS
jgi:hypothetical protein